jgi:hypothetical protein
MSKTSPAPSVSERIDELRQQALRAALNYEVWWVYRSSDTRPKYVDVMNRYTVLFATAIHAHFVAMLVALYSLYETREDTHSIPQLLETLRTEGKLGEDLIDAFNSRYQQLKPFWVKVSMLRNDAFAHRSSTYAISEVFTRANVKPDELRVLVDGTASLLNEVSRRHDRSAHAFNTGAREAALALLEDLRMFHGAGD